MEKALAGIVGADNVTRDGAAIAPFFREAPPSGKHTLVRIGTDEENVKVVGLCAEKGVKIFTLQDSHLPAAYAEMEGVILDFSRMTGIQKIDVKNNTAWLDRGVTWEQAMEAMAKKGKHLATPVAATSRSVAVSYRNRDVVKKCSRHPEVHSGPMHIALADGTMLKTGSHAFSEENGDIREDIAANITRMFFGDEESFGVMSWSAVWIYPERGNRRAVVHGHDDLDSALKTIKYLSRKEIGYEAMVLDRAAVEEVTGLGDAPPFVSIVGLEGPRVALIDYHEKFAKEYAASKGGKYAESLCGPMMEALLKPWYVELGDHLQWFNTYAKMPAVAGVVEEAAKKKGVPLSRKFASFAFGSGLLAVYRDLGRGVGLMEDTAAELLRAGAFFHRPPRPAAVEAYGKMPNEARHVKRLKEFYDPKNVLNDFYL